MGRLRRQRVLVVGAGCGGVLVARELLRSDAEVVLVESVEAGLGRGVAYRAGQPWHLLNSPARVMSGDPDRPADFVEWCRTRALSLGPDDFAPRRCYGDYLAHLLDSAVVAFPDRLTIRSATVTGVVPTGSGVRVDLAEGAPIHGDHVVIATGGPRVVGPPHLAALAGHPRYVPDPWHPGALDAVPRNAPVLLVGTGLTAVDVVLSLCRTGQVGQVTAASRHGLLPHSHQPHAVVDAGCTIAATGPVATGGEWPPPGLPLAGLIRAIRLAAAGTPDWRTVVDGLRPELDRLWGDLQQVDQERFLRHVGRHWEVHRHRMAPAVAAELARLRDRGDLVVRAGTIRAIVAEPGGVVRVALDGTPSGRFGAVVNCAGPGRLPAAADPLTRTLLSQGCARPGPHALGLETDPVGRLVDRSGRVDPRLWLIGALRRGRLWETTAVPEIRRQARELATALAAAPVPVAV